ncbi:hypothetical protein B7P43_G14533 [Cryptotermes secundus]|uniref:Angiotensin-converting enzyme n=1 Tax=Cryptotermes secundus TaxID=105785 RepID=A0A2J7R0L7_9NEOP|nr:hypothetical protein B7P43_G14533 [Cryptotermes secundus]
MYQVRVVCFSELNTVLGLLQNTYSNARVCRRDVCYRGEPDLERLMAESRDPAELLWGWQEWRRAVGPPSRHLYPVVVGLMNQAARNNDYRDIGECWREELETPNLEHVVEELYRQVEPLYTLLHAVVRFRLAQFYGEETVPLTGPIPAHLLGNMWAQNWEALLDLLLPDQKMMNLTSALHARNYTTVDMVRHAEDFYTSLGLERMTHSFWTHSQIERPADNNGTCHGTAANMYQSGDYRMLLCAEVNAEDFYVIHHEMGHVEYYMAYRNQPTVFQEGANSAFQEAVGDSVMYGVVAPQHLQRLGLINDTSQDNDLVLLLRQALFKLPQLPFGLLVDKWRWSVFRGDTPPEQYNIDWWELKRHYQGIVPPIPRADDDFDPAAKFHIPDNTPYIRYFLSDILQVQMFKGMCEAAVLGRVGTGEALPMPLHRCDIYGSKQAGKRLRGMMSMGSSQPWGKALQILTGNSYYDVKPLLQYYEPIYRWLQAQIQRYNIPVGWE